MANTASQVTNSDLDPVFYPFLELPYELRAKIWMEHLKEATPLLYRFEIQYSLRSRVRSDIIYDHNIYHYVAKPKDTVILKPIAFDGYDEEQLPNLIRSTLSSRTALATCTESRQIALKILPDSLPFRKLPRLWTLFDDTKDDPADGTAYPEYILRFNGAKDIIIFHASWENQEAVVEISKFQGYSPDGFSRMQHIGLTVGALDEGHGYHSAVISTAYGVNPAECRCSTVDCHDVSDLGSDHDRKNRKGAYLEDAGCRCETEEGRVGGSAKKHIWSTIRSSDIDRWCVAWDERTGCFRTNYIVKAIRENWRPNFPYYKALEHLDIKFLRRLDPGGNSMPGLVDFGRAYD
ncbi:hypothetical protein OIDMADRAFT_143054 [Oidiodendron maius Zn]|uniref:2EXR domain-containing protein n=1 Tax=Oidiodendron maius (strain Zn) TaxID=913774 RepID=A0A0C3H5D0_OIDMZ|nr:hypothetical protein OIDMADRAFT_143054 [Oidiodendron maius Zn]